MVNEWDATELQERSDTLEQSVEQHIASALELSLSSQTTTPNQQRPPPPRRTLPAYLDFSLSTSTPQLDSKAPQPFVPPNTDNMDPAERTVVNWILRRMCKSTNKTYSPYVKEFITWASQQGKQAFPAAPALVAAFLIHLSEDRGLKASTINIAASAISSQYKFAHIKSPTLDPLVQLTKRIIKQISQPPTQKLPLTVEMATAIAMRHKQDVSFTGIRDTFMILLAMSSFCRADELVHLEATDVWLDTVSINNKHENVLFIYVEHSKTERSRLGYTVVVPQSATAIVDPVSWFQKYARVRALSATHFFHSSVSPYAALSNSTPNHIVKSELEAIGVDPKLYGSHSCRSGGVSEAAAKDCEIHLLKRHGNWKSDAIFNYVRDSWEKQLKVRVF